MVLTHFYSKECITLLQLMLCYYRYAILYDIYGWT